MIGKEKVENALIVASAYLVVGYCMLRQMFGGFRERAEQKPEPRVRKVPTIVLHPEEIEFEPGPAALGDSNEKIAELHRRLFPAILNRG